MIIDFTTDDEWADSADDLAENVNGIGGKTLITALSDHLKASGDQVEEVFDEDFGWCFYATHRGSRYFITTSIEPDETDSFYGVVGVQKQRGMLEKLLGKNKMESADPVKSKLHAFLDKDQHIALSADGWEMR